MANIRKYIKVIACAALLAVPAVGALANPAEQHSAAMQVAAQPQIKVLKGQIEITVPGDEARQVAVYAITGQIVKNFAAAPGATVVDLPSGYYIVKCDRISCRVVIK